MFYVTIFIIQTQFYMIYIAVDWTYVYIKNAVLFDKLAHLEVPLHETAIGQNVS